MCEQAWRGGVTGAGSHVRVAVQQTAPLTASLQPVFSVTGCRAPAATATSLSFVPAQGAPGGSRSPQAHGARCPRPQEHRLLVRVSCSVSRGLSKGGPAPPASPLLGPRSRGRLLGKLTPPAWQTCAELWPTRLFLGRLCWPVSLLACSQRVALVSVAGRYRLSRPRGQLGARSVLVGRALGKGDRADVAEVSTAGAQ